MRKSSNAFGQPFPTPEHAIALLFTECNWWAYMSSGTAFGAPIGGGDLFNLGSVGMGGVNYVTGAYGVKYKPSVNSELGIAYEFPYSQRKDLMQDRLTVDLIIRY